MGRSSEINKSVLLLDSFNAEGKTLYESFINAGYKGPVLVIEEDGFLPDGVISIYQYFCGEYITNDNIPGKPRYFNQIDIPDYWSISGDGGMAYVRDMSKERGRIFYNGQRHKRLVKVVDWKDEKDNVRCCEHYNGKGALYAKTYFNKKNEKFCKIYFDANGKEVIYENYGTKDIMLSIDGKDYIFNNKVEFIIKVIEDLNAKNATIFFNTLSTPFFVSNMMNKDGKGDVLFWQEGPRNDIPGNMKTIFNGQSNQVKKIYVQNKDSYNKLIELGADKNIVELLGNVYTFLRSNNHSNKILICTNSDNIEKCEQLIQSLPDMEFNIVALTEMSSKLLSLGKYRNVNLYPNAKNVLIDELFNTCDYYFDINHETEIVDAVRQAFINNLLILGFHNTLHNKKYIHPDHVFKNDADLVEFSKKIVDNNTEMDKSIQVQHEHAMSENVEKYIHLLNKWEEER